MTDTTNDNRNGHRSNLPEDPCPLEEKAMKYRPLIQKWLPLLFLLIFAVPSILILFPMKALPATAPDNRFSAARAFKHLDVIAAIPHPEGSPAQIAVQDYLLQSLRGLGLEPEVQKVYGAENVIVLLPGNSSTGAALFLAHYDSSQNSPGAADNGSGVSVLLEAARALSSGPQLANDIILLFDDGEELPDAFTGSKAFVREHPLMDRVKVAVSIDTATKGPVSICETGKENGWIVRVLSNIYTNGAWTSLSGGGGYDSTPFRNAGVMVLALEDNYPFKEKHTQWDTPSIVSPGSVQQLGDTVLALARRLGDIDLSDTRGEDRTFFPIPFTALVHYPVSWTQQLFILACVLLVFMFFFSFRNKVLTLGGFFLALGVILVSAGICGVMITLLKPLLPGIFGWNTALWPDWPEVIPPNSGYALAGFALLVTGVTYLAYRLCRRRCSPAEFSIAGLLPFYLFSGAFSFLMPMMAYPFLWPALLGSSAWLFCALIQGNRTCRSAVPALIAALPLMVLLLPFIPGIVMADGMKSLEILGAVFALILFIVLPAVDSLIYRKKGSETAKPV